MIGGVKFGATISLEGSNKKYHTFDDWEMVIESRVFISEPEAQQNYIEVPGSNTMLDVSEAISGHPVFRKRKISFTLAGVIPNRNNWDSKISRLRNTFEGRIVHITFDNDKEFYWKGRLTFTGFDRIMEIGRVTVELPNADPFKYNIHSNVDPWLWDPFNFFTGVIPKKPIITVNGTETTVVPAGSMWTTPTFTVNKITSGTSIKVSVNGRTHELSQGVNIIPSIEVNGDHQVQMTFTGYGELIMEYRGGSL